MSVRKRHLAALMRLMMVVIYDLCVCVHACVCVPHPPSQAVDHNICLSACFTQCLAGVFD